MGASSTKSVQWSRTLDPHMSLTESSEHVLKKLSSKFDEFLAARSQFDSDHGFDFYVPTCFQSATYVRTLFAFYLRMNAVFALESWHFVPRMNAVFALDVPTTLRQINR